MVQFFLNLAFAFTIGQCARNLRPICVYGSTHFCSACCTLHLACIHAEMSVTYVYEQETHPFSSSDGLCRSPSQVSSSCVRKRSRCLSAESVTPATGHTKYIVSRIIDSNPLPSELGLLARDLAFGNCNLLRSLSILQRNIRGNCCPVPKGQLYVSTAVSSPCVFLLVCVFRVRSIYSHTNDLLFHGT